MDGYAAIGDAVAWLADHATGEVGSLAMRLVLAGLFLVAGVHKLRHPLIAAASAANFGVVAHATARVGYAIGTLELTTAGLLLAVPSPGPVVAGGLLAGLLSLAFLAIIVRALVRGDRFPCHCLSSSEDEISAATLLRAAGMAAAAAIGTVGAVRGDVMPTVEPAAEAVGLAAALAGVPVVVHAGLTIWRRHRRFMNETDWEWVLMGDHR